MSSKKSYLTVTDQFCGAGGSSIGATAAGIELRLALNHWDLAIQTHNTNFPNAAHDCTDISACNPRRYPSTDILITSPECTNHSLAKGKRKPTQQPDLFGLELPDPAEERSRATMWDVPRFAEYHRYRAIIVENVVDARQWVTWDAWLLAMHQLGYEHKIVFLNSMHAHPTPQSRDRMYVVFWQKGNKAPNLNLTPSAWCERCGQDVSAMQAWKNNSSYGRYRTQYIYACPHCRAPVEPYYYCAASAIDWSLPAPRIGDRKKPLTDKTIARIRAGIAKFGRQAITVDTAFSDGDRTLSMLDAMRTQTTRQTIGIATPPFMIDVVHTPRGSDTSMVSNLLRPMRTQIGQTTHALILPYYRTGQASSTDEPLPTVTTIDRHALAVPPFLLGYYTRISGIEAAVSSIDEPVPTQSTQPRHYLVQPNDLDDIDAWGFRMLQPHESQAAMAFPSDYQVLGNKREQVRQLGNAVTPPAMKMLMERVVATFQ